MAAQPLAKAWRFADNGEFVKGFGARGLARAKVADGGEWTQSPLAKNITPEARAAVNAAVGAQPGD